MLGVGNAGKCTKQRAKKAYSQKRKYHPPKNKEPADSTTHKNVDVDMGSQPVETETVEGYRLFDMGLLSKLFGDLLCPDCHMFQSSVLVVIHEVNILPPLYRV